jgi:hypothetical protein
LSKEQTNVTLSSTFENSKRVGPYAAPVWGVGTVSSVGGERFFVQEELPQSMLPLMVVSSPA